MPSAQKAPAAALEQPAERPRPAAPPAAKPAGVAQPAEAGRPGKRRGPLPLWLVELVVIAAVPGLLYALLRWEAQARRPPARALGLVTLPYSAGLGAISGLRSFQWPGVPGEGLWLSTMPPSLEARRLAREGR